MKPTDYAAEKGLPEAIEAEKVILGCIMQAGHEDGANELLANTAALLNPDDFALQAHRTIFRAMQELDRRGTAVDNVTVALRLQDQDSLERCGGVLALVELRDNCPRLPNIESYVNAVRDKAQLRRIIFAARDIANRCIRSQESAEDVLAHGEAILATLGSTQDRQRWRSPAQVISEHPGGFEAFVNPQRSGSGISTPWPRINAMLCGLQKQQLIVLGARPSMGKSAAALQLALHVAGQYQAADSDSVVAYISLEMSEAALTRRLICMAGNVDSHKMRSGWLSADDRRRAAAAAHEVAQLPVWIDSSSSMTAPLIRAALRRIGCEGSLGLVIIDHFHLVQGIGREEQRVRYSNIADDFQRYAKDFDVPLVALCQLNRGAENEKRQPVLSDLKETGKLEENADVVAFIHRAEMFNRHDPALKGIAQVIIAKQREGPIGQVQMQFRHETQTFEEVTDDREDRED